MKLINKLLLTSGIALLAGCHEPNIEGIQDFTGDGIPDIMVSVNDKNLNYLFIGQEDGTFIRTEESTYSGFRAFLTEDGEYHIFNGDYYMSVPKR